MRHGDLETGMSNPWRAQRYQHSRALATKKVIRSENGTAIPIGRA
jgi:hypothetical protein